MNWKWLRYYIERPGQWDELTPAERREALFWLVLLVVGLIVAWIAVSIPPIRAAIQTFLGVEISEV